MRTIHIDDIPMDVPEWVNYIAWDPEDGSDYPEHCWGYSEKPRMADDDSYWIWRKGSKFCGVPGIPIPQTGFWDEQVYRINRNPREERCGLSPEGLKTAFVVGFGATSIFLVLLGLISWIVYRLING